MRKEKRSTRHVVDRDELAEIAVELEIGLTEAFTLLEVLQDLVNDFKVAIKLADEEE